jgi:hypothetical protein
MKARNISPAALVVLFCVSACSFHCYPPDTPADVKEANDPPPGVDADEYGRADAAGQACFVLKWLGCSEGSPEGMECDASIRELVSIGTFRKSNLICIRTSRTVERVRNCDVACSNK